MKQEKFSVEYQKFVYGAMLAFILVILPVLVSLPKLDIWLHLAAGCFAIAAPLLALCLTMIHFKNNTPPNINRDWYSRWNKYQSIIIWASLGGGLIGIELVFLHISLLIGLLYVASASFCTYILYKCIPLK
jgi:hypothetical protein